MNAPLVFRVDAGDAAAIGEVAALEADAFTNPWTRDMLARELQQSQSARVYALRAPDGVLAAFCSCWFVADELHINTVAVAAAHRRRGLATLLMCHVMEEAAAAGLARGTLEVRRSNLAALRLYESLGFRVAAERRGYYSHPVEDALILWADTLTPPRTAC